MTGTVRTLLHCGMSWVKGFMLQGSVYALDLHQTFASLMLSWFLPDKVYIKSTGFIGNPHIKA